MAKLVINLADKYIDTYQFTAKNKIFLGRHPKCHLHLDNFSISNKHAAIYTEDGKFYIEDLGSTNGTIMNNKLITKHLLIDGEIIEISKYRIVFWSK